MLNELSSRFLKVLKYLIEEHEVSDNKDFASRISVSTSMITEISKGRSNVGVSAIQNTVLQFPINSDWLLTGRGSMLRDNKTSEENKLGYAASAKANSGETSYEGNDRRELELLRGIWKAKRGTGLI